MRDLADVVAGLADGQRPLPPDQLLQVGAVHEFEDEEVAAVDLVGVVGGDDVRVDELGRRPHLAQEHFLGAVGAQQVGGQHFEGDDAAHRAVFGLEDAAHAAAADLVENAVLPQQKARRAADQEALGLELGEQALFDEGAGHRPAAAAAGRQFRLGPRQLLLADEAALAHVGQKSPPVDLLRGCHDDRLGSGAVFGTPPDRIPCKRERSRREGLRRFRSL